MHVNVFAGVGKRDDDINFDFKVYIINLLVDCVNWLNFKIHVHLSTSYGFHRKALKVLWLGILESWNCSHYTVNPAGLVGLKNEGLQLAFYLILRFSVFSCLLPSLRKTRRVPYSVWCIYKCMVRLASLLLGKPRRKELKYCWTVGATVGVCCCATIWIHHYR